MTDWLQPADLRTLETFEFAPRAVVEGYLAGRHRSRVAGASTEFRDYRAYAPGDDPRQVDWRVFARSDRYYLRTHNQETNTRLHLIVDSSASMGFGDPVAKIRYASFFAAAAAYLATRGGDAVSLTLFDRALRRHLPSGTTGGHFRALCHALQENTPGAATDLPASLRLAAPLLRGRGTVLVLSDFYADPGEILGALAPFAHRGHEVHLFHVLDPGEIHLTDRGLHAFHDLETGQRLVAHASALAAPYARAVAEHLDRLRAAVSARGMTYTLARTDTPWTRLFDRLVA